MNKEIQEKLSTGELSVGDARHQLESSKQGLIDAYGQYLGTQIYNDARDTITKYIVRAREMGVL